MGKKEEALKKLGRRQWPTRKRGMEELAALGERDELLKYALKDNVAAVIDVAADALFPEPAELLIHILTATKGPDAALASRYHLPYGNYLYAEDAIVDLYRKRGTRLPLKTVEGVGLAYLRGMAPALRRMVQVPLVTLEEALRWDGPKARGGVVIVQGKERHNWSGRSMKSITAAVALRRMDCDLDTGIVRDMLDQLDEVMVDCQERRITRAKLQWILRDIEREHFDDLLDGPLLAATEVLSDVCTSLLKRGETTKIKELVEALGDIYVISNVEFCFWPLLNHLDASGLADSRSGRAGIWYGRAREHGLSPPPWWQWQ